MTGQRMTIKEMADSLNLASDDMSVQVEAFEGTLNSLRLGVAGWVTANHIYWLGYSNKVADAKIAGKQWCLLIQVRKIGQDPKQWQHWKFNDAPRYLRVSLVRLLPALMEHMVTQSQNMLKSVERANEFLGQCLEGVKLAQEETENEKRRAVGTK